MDTSKSESSRNTSEEKPEREFTGECPFRSLDLLALSIHANNVKVGWYDGFDPEKDIPTKLCLIHSEVSEAMEAKRRSSTIMTCI